MEIKKFTFFRGEDDDEIISQVEWNRRRDALADAAQEYNDYIRMKEAEESFLREIQNYKNREKEKSLWSKIWTQLKQPLIFVPITVFGGFFTLYWLLRLIDYLSKLK